MISELGKLLSCLGVQIPVLMVIGSSFITQTNSYECDRYCNKDCTDYFQSSGLGDCLSANLHCDCSSPTNISKLVWLAIVILFCTSACCCMGFKICRNRRLGRSTLNPCYDIVAEPVVNNLTNRTSSISAPHSPSTSFVAASPVPQKPSVSPPPEEYLQPPAYNECNVVSSLPPHDF